MNRQRILIVEDDPHLARAMKSELGRTYSTKVVSTGRQALFLAETQPFDLIVLDLNLPDIDGLVVSEQLKGNGVEILMVTARADVRSRVEGLYAGASDYLSKPFEMIELVARVEARLRGRTQPRTLVHGALSVHVDRRVCTVEDVEVALGAQEFRLLELLMTNKDRVYSKDDIEDRLYRDGGTSSNAVEALVSKLRRKLTEAGAENPITTVRGFGYVIRD